MGLMAAGAAGPIGWHRGRMAGVCIGSIIGRVVFGWFRLWS